MFTVVSKYCSDLSMAVTAHSVSCLKFIFSILATLPRHPEMRCESTFTKGNGKGSEEQWGQGCTCHMHGFFQGEERLLHLTSLHTLVGLCSILFCINN